jgi:hypothetical protein
MRSRLAQFVAALVEPECVFEMNQRLAYLSAPQQPPPRLAFVVGSTGQFIYPSSPSSAPAPIWQAAAAMMTPKGDLLPAKVIEASSNMVSAVLL